MTMACGKKKFYECVACVCLTFGTIFIGYCFLYGIWVLGGCDDCIICTTNWLLQISLGSRKWLSYKDFILKDTELLVFLPWPSRKQSTNFINSNSNLHFLTCWILSANTDPLVCVGLALWKELNHCFLSFFLESLSFAMLGILSTPLFEMNCPLQIIKELSTLENNFATETVLEKCVQTVHVLVVETECIQFL